MTLMQNIFNILNSFFVSVLVFAKSHVILSLIALKIIVASFGIKYLRKFIAKRKRKKEESEINHPPQEFS